MNRLLTGIANDDLLVQCKPIVNRGAAARAIQVRDALQQIYGWADDGGVVPTMFFVSGT